MTDITTTQARADVELSEIERMRADLIAERERNAELENALTVARREASKPVTDGADPRLAQFWDIAAEAADEENFCEEYDRIAEALGGRPRRREYKVRLCVQAHVDVTVSVTARNADDAEDMAHNVMTSDDVERAISENGLGEFDISSADAEEA